MHPTVAAELSREFLQRLAMRAPATIPELNEGLSPAWQENAAADLLQSGQITEDASGRYALTPKGRAALTEGMAKESPALTRSRYPRRAG